jgi:hypothetical protein
MLTKQHYERYKLAVHCHLLELDLRFRRRDYPPDHEREVQHDVLNWRDELLKELEDLYSQ